jgi:hypothetical protein
MNLDDVGNAVLNMEQNMDEQRPQELAKYVLVLFVRGIATDLQFPLAHFATGGIGTSEIKNKYRFSPTANGLSVQ